MRTFLGTACFAGSFLIATASWAAEVQSNQGDLSINQGQGYQRVDGRIDANVGDSIMVSPGGSATVSYDDGCQVSVQPGAVVTIGQLSPCASGSFAQDQFQFQSQYWTPYILGGIILGGALGFGIYAATIHNHHHQAPVSP
jgi:hypothetical protein